MLPPRKPHAIARQLARWVLLCLVFSWGLVIASPLLHPQPLEWVCTSAGAAKLLPKAPDGHSQPSSQMGDCPLCLTAGAPPPAARLRVEPIQPLAYVLRTVPAAHIAYPTAAPLPARGPPVWL